MVEHAVYDEVVLLSFCCLVGCIGKEVGIYETTSLLRGGVKTETTRRYLNSLFTW